MCARLIGNSNLDTLKQVSTVSLSETRNTLQRAVPAARTVFKEEKKTAYQNTHENTAGLPSENPKHMFRLLLSKP
jgi:hypothetical protein